MTRDYIKSDFGYTIYDVIEWAKAHGEMRAEHDYLDGVLESAGLPSHCDICESFAREFRDRDGFRPLDAEGCEHIFDVATGAVHDAYLASMDDIANAELDAWETRYEHDEFR